MDIENIEFDQFIGSFDTPADTEPLIEFFKFSEQSNCSFKRHRRDENVTTVKDRMLPMDFFADDVAHQLGQQYVVNRTITSKFLGEYNNYVNECLNMYADQFPEIAGYDLQSVFLNVQKTLPGEGYHVWHHEQGGEGCTRRVLATSMYLNDDFEGGETEFLYQHKRVKPKRGRFLIWPAGFTHVHRGNPPLTGAKYLSTSWVEVKQI